MVQGMFQLLFLTCATEITRGKIKLRKSDRKGDKCKETFSKGPVLQHNSPAKQGYYFSCRKSVSHFPMLSPVTFLLFQPSLNIPALAAFWFGFQKKGRYTSDIRTRLEATCSSEMYLCCWQVAGTGWVLKSLQLNPVYGILWKAGSNTLCTIFIAVQNICITLFTASQKATQPEIN